MGFHQFSKAPEGEREVGHHCQEWESEVGHALTVGDVGVEAEEAEDKGPAMGTEAATGRVKYNPVLLLLYTFISRE